MKSAYVDIAADIGVTVKNVAGQELSNELYEVEVFGEEVEITIKGGVSAAAPDYSPMIQRIRDLANDNGFVDFLPVLDRFQREVELEWLRTAIPKVQD